VELAGEEPCETTTKPRVFAIADLEKYNSKGGELVLEE
jgi:hypothetical protein